MPTKAPPELFYPVTVQCKRGAGLAEAVQIGEASRSFAELWQAEAQLLVDEMEATGRYVFSPELEATEGIAATSLSRALRITDAQDAGAPSA